MPTSGLETILMMQDWRIMNRFGVIMAGGGGTRFWPLSRKDLPKQFLNLTGGDLMVNETIDRLARSVLKEDIFIVTNHLQAQLMLSSTDGRVREDHILAEPAARNTSACIGYAALEIVKKYGDGIMCILPSDHYIKDMEGYDAVMEEAFLAAEKTDYLIRDILFDYYYATTRYSQSSINATLKYIKSSFITLFAENKKKSKCCKKYKSSKPCKSCPKH